MIMQINGSILKSIIMTPKIIVIVQEGDARQAYLAELESIDVEVSLISSFIEIQTLLSEDSYNGVVVDLKTKMKATADEKELALDLLEQFPFAQLNLEIKTGTIKLLCYDQMMNVRTLKDFVDIVCTSFIPRAIRLHARKENNFNILLSRTSDFPENETEHTVTIDISKGGCFIYSIGNWEINTNVQIVINEINDRSPILCEVRRVVKWGEAMKIPGIGVQFIDISEDQLEGFCKVGHIS